MPTADVIERVRAIAGRIAASYGLEVFDVQFRREGSGMVLRVQIDRPGPAATAEESVSVDDCATVSRDLSAVLDVDDVVPTAYVLEVSSPGLDRPLVRDRDFERFAGNEVRIETAAPLEGRRHFRGRLERLEEGMVRLALEDGTEVSIPRELVTRARLEPGLGPGGASRTKGRHA